jgi:hypothetical protein
MRPSREKHTARRAWRRSLATLLFIGALSAVGGGVAILVSGGLGMPASMLEGSPFTSFTVPALILIAVVGGTQTLALSLVLGRRAPALFWSAVAGFGLTIWIMVETIIIQGFSALQAFYFVLGIAELTLVLVLLGIAPRLTRIAPTTTSRTTGALVRHPPRGRGSWPRRAGR